MNRTSGDAVPIGSSPPQIELVPRRRSATAIPSERQSYSITRRRTAARRGRRGPTASSSFGEERHQALLLRR